MVLVLFGKINMAKFKILFRVPLDMLDNLAGSPQSGDHLTLEVLAQVVDVLVDDENDGVVELNGSMFRVTHHEMNPGKHIGRKGKRDISQPIPSPSG